MPIQAILLSIIFPLMFYFSYRYGREREKDPEYQRKKREKALRRKRFWNTPCRNTAKYISPSS